MIYMMVLPHRRENPRQEVQGPIFEIKGFRKQTLEVLHNKWTVAKGGGSTKEAQGLVVGRWLTFILKRCPGGPM
jgi:hypothetical protein